MSYFVTDAVNNWNAGFISKDFQKRSIMRQIIGDAGLPAETGHLTAIDCLFMLKRLDPSLA
jgi:hypothetical protein